MKLKMYYVIRKSENLTNYNDKNKLEWKSGRFVTNPRPTNHLMTGANVVFVLAFSFGKTFTLHFFHTSWGHDENIYNNNMSLYELDFRGPRKGVSRSKYVCLRFLLEILVRRRRHRNLPK